MKASAAQPPGRALWLLLLCLLQAAAAGKNAVATVATDRRGSSVGTGTGANAAAAHGARKFWPFDTGVAFSLNGDDLPVPDWKAKTSMSLATIDLSSIVPGEGVVPDETVPTPPRKRMEPRFVEDQQNVGSVMYRTDEQVGSGGLSTLAINKKTKAWVDGTGAEWATPESDSTDAPSFEGGKTNLPSVSKPENFKEEYDVASDETPNAALGDVSGHEQVTKEDTARQRSGDVTKQSVRLRRARAAHMETPHLAAAQQQQRVQKSAEQLNAEAGEASEEAMQTLQAMPPGPAKQKAQCMAYANYLKSQDIQGSELVKVWKLTCTPAVDAGAASPGYATMCGTIGGAVAKFAIKRNWDPSGCCDAVIRVFTESGLGATPLGG